jgi:hypothetical protein
MPRVRGGSEGDERFLMGEVPLYIVLLPRASSDTRVGPGGTEEVHLYRGYSNLKDSHRPRTLRLFYA